VKKVSSSKGKNSFFEQTASTTVTLRTGKKGRPSPHGGREGGNGTKGRGMARVFQAKGSSLHHTGKEKTKVCTRETGLRTKTDPVWVGKVPVCPRRENYVKKLAALSMERRLKRNLERKRGKRERGKGFWKGTCKPRRPSRIGERISGEKKRRNLEKGGVLLLMYRLEPGQRAIDR